MQRRRSAAPRAAWVGMVMGLLLPQLVLLPSHGATAFLRPALPATQHALRQRHLNKGMMRMSSEVLEQKAPGMYSSSACLPDRSYVPTR